MSKTQLVARPVIGRPLPEYALIGGRPMGSVHSKAATGKQGRRTKDELT